MLAYLFGKYITLSCTPLWIAVNFEQYNCKYGIHNSITSVLVVAVTGTTASKLEIELWFPYLHLY